MLCAQRYQRKPMSTPSETDAPVTSTDTIATPGRELRAVHECEHLKRDGKPCRRYVATIFTPPYPGAAAEWLGPQQKARQPKADTPSGPPAAPKPPVSHLKSPAD